MIENGFQGKDGQQIPEITDEFIETVTTRYIELYEKVNGEEFIKNDLSDLPNQIKNSIIASL